MSRFAKYRENYLGVVIGVICGCLVWWANPSYKDSVELIKAMPTLTTCIFGFLLTLLGIILQGDGPVISEMKESQVIYNRFVDYNKKVVVLSFVMTLLALLASYFPFAGIRDWMLTVNPCLVGIVRKTILSTLSIGSVWLVVDLVVFVRLFYMLIKQSR